MQQTSTSVLGLFYMILGFILFLLAAGELLLRFALIILALWLISYGMQLRGLGSITRFYWQWQNRNR